MAQNEFSSAFSSAFDAEVSDFPPAPCTGWPVSWACNQAFAEELQPEVKAYAEALAGQTLQMLTGYRVGGCPIEVRPCSPRCAPGTWLTAPDGSINWAGYSGWGMSPYVGAGGQWLNACGCKTNDCSCTSVPQVTLPGPVGHVTSVVLDGVTLPNTSYRVDNFDRLVRTDGLDWPTCQDMAADSGEGTFIVTYTQGALVDLVGSFVAGILAVEFAKACTGGDCALPSRVTSVTRQGVSMQMDPQMFDNGLTGMQAVDSYIRIWNPMQSQKTGIYSPDLPRARRVTWRA